MCKITGQKILAQRSSLSRAPLYQTLLCIFEDEIVSLSVRPVCVLLPL